MIVVPMALEGTQHCAYLKAQGTRSWAKLHLKKIVFIDKIRIRIKRVGEINVLLPQRYNQADAEIFSVQVTENLSDSAEFLYRDVTVMDKAGKRYLR